MFMEEFAVLCEVFILSLNLKCLRGSKMGRMERNTSTSTRTRTVKVLPRLSRYLCGSTFIQYNSVTLSVHVYSIIIYCRNVESCICMSLCPCILHTFVQTVNNIHPK